MTDTTTSITLTEFIHMEIITILMQVGIHTMIHGDSHQTTPHTTHIIQQTITTTIITGHLNQTG